MAKLDFSYLIAPFTAADFFDRYWQKSALVIKRGETDRSRGLIDAADTAAILALANRWPAESVEVIGEIQTDERSAATTDALADLFSKGATIRVKAVDRFIELPGALCRNLEEELGFPVRANLYCTPGNSRGFNLHFDTHEVFVLQLFGKKQWQIYEPTVRLPLEFVPPLPFENNREALKRFRGGRESGQDEIRPTELGPLVLEELLEPGDCLYLPRGFVHQAVAHDEPSVHLTIGLHVLTWLDLLSVALGQAAYRNEDFRRALPAGLFREGSNAGEFEKKFDALGQLFVRDAVLANAVREIAESFARRPRSGSPGDNHDALGDVGRVDRETKLEGNGQLRFYLAADGTMAGLACDQKEFWLPVGFAPALRFVTEQKVFRPLELPGSMTDNGKLAFVRNLVKDGFLRVAQ
jgi:ribosomal protein L16 Arg81 hydroxylase